MILTEDRDNILQSMEEHNVALTKTFEKYRQIRNLEWPKIDEDGDIDPETGKFLTDLYYKHREVLQEILGCAGSLKKDIEDLECFFKRGKEKQQKLKKKLSERPKEYTQENIRHVFYNLLNHFELGLSLTGKGNSLEKNNLVSNFKIDNGIIYGDISDFDNNIYSSSIDMNLFQHKHQIMEKLPKDNINLENILSLLNELKIEIIPEDFHKLKCKCSCNTKQPCAHTIALYFRFIDNIKINKNIVLELFGIN
jgi:hypothetical protein